MKKSYVVALFAASLIIAAATAQAAIVSTIDPTGGAEIDHEVGTLSIAAFEALSPTIRDWEGTANQDGMGGKLNGPLDLFIPEFLIDGVTVTGIYGGPRIMSDLGTGRTSFTLDAGGGPGNWNNTVNNGEPSNNNLDTVVFNFAGPKVTAVGLAIIGRETKNPTHTATVTFGDGTTDTGSVDLVGALDSKDTFFGFSGNGSGIAKITFTSSQRNFAGWDDLGVVTVPEPASLALGSLALLGLAVLRRRSK